MTDEEKEFKKFVNKHLGWKWIFHRKLRDRICGALVRQSNYMKSHPMSYEEAKSPVDVAKSLAFIYQSPENGSTDTCGAVQFLQFKILFQHCSNIFDIQ